MGIASSLARQVRKVKKLSKPPTDGQQKIEPVTREQRAYAKGQVKAAAATALTAAAISKMSNSEAKDRLAEETIKAKNEELSAKDRQIAEKNRQLLRAKINETVAEVNATGMKGNNTRGTSPRPKLRPKEMAKGGYANCGASMKATQKSTNMAYGGMARKK